MVKKYKTANGKIVDLDGLRLKNEDTIAVGNMRVNARGDELGPGGQVVKTRNERMNENYKLHTMVPKDDVVPTSSKPKPKPQQKSAEKIVEEIMADEPATEPEKTEPAVEKATKTPPADPPKVRGAMAAALAGSKTTTTVNPIAPTTPKKVRRIGQ